MLVGNWVLISKALNFPAEVCGLAVEPALKFVPFRELLFIHT